MTTTTVLQGAPKPKPIARRQLQRTLRRLGLSQNALARRIGKDPGLVSRVIRREVPSSIVWGRIHAFLADPVHYAPPRETAA
jgi:hypothetical protein